MQETCNGCLGLKKCSTSLRQAITGIHECRKITVPKVEPKSNCYFLALVLTCYRLTKGRATFLTRNNCCEFLASDYDSLLSTRESFFKTPVCDDSCCIYVKCKICFSRIQDLFPNIWEDG